MIIKTKRLILRPLKISDWKDVIEGANDLEVSKNLSVVSYPYKKEDALKWIKVTIKNWNKKEKDDYTFAIELKKEKKVIGATGIHEISKRNGIAQTGSWINKNYWRKGYILEAKVAILDFAFNKLKLRKIESGAFAQNIASSCMSKSLGFKFEGKQRKQIICLATKKVHDILKYGILKEEWKKSRLGVIKKVEKKIKQVP